VEKENMVYKHHGVLFSHKKKNEIMSFAGEWMSLGIMLSEISQAQKVKHCRF
jgi:hypothetical protein